MARKAADIALYVLIIILAAAFVFPVAVVLIHSFKAKFSINASPFTLPLGDDFVGLSNYTEGIKNT